MTNLSGSSKESFGGLNDMREFRQGDVLSLEQANTINNALACIQELKEHAKKQKTKKTDFIQTATPSGSDVHV